MRSYLRSSIILQQHLLQLLTIITIIVIFVATTRLCMRRTVIYPETLCSVGWGGGVSLGHKCKIQLNAPPPPFFCQTTMQKGGAYNRAKYGTLFLWDHEKFLVQSCSMCLMKPHANLVSLQPGGEMYFSDIYANHPVPESLKANKVLWGKCFTSFTCSPVQIVYIIITVYNA